MRRTRIYLLGTALAAALAVFHVATPRAAHAEDVKHQYTISELSENCGGSCGTGKICCRIVIVAPTP
jgi:hypothetical protein